MKLSFNILFFGWWLARQCWTSRGQTLPKPLVSTNFNGTVALGEKATIFCRSRNDFGGTFYLSRYTSWSYETVKATAAQSNRVAFSLIHLSQSRGGIYRCRFCQDASQGNICSPFSDEIYLNLTDPSLIKPTIQILNVTKRPYFTIRCEGIEQDLTFALLKSKKQIKYKAAESGEKAVDFFLYWTRLEEAQSYTCQYHQESNPFLWSVPSDPLELPLRGVINSHIWARMAVSLFLLILALLAAVWYKKGEKSSDAGEHPNKVSYAILNHQPQKT